jgi:3-hydroxyisobutyrate dehydrogenase
VQVTVLGLGAMGSRMALRLLDAGYQVTVWNRTEGSVQTLQTQGATMRATPREAVRNSDFVIAMVRDDIASRSVWTDPENGALMGMQSGAVAIDSSTLTPEWTVKLGKLCENRGVQFIEAPVAGSRPQAESAQLIYFLGGGNAAIKRAEPLFKTMGASIHHVGPIGDAAVVKLFTNAMFGLQVAGLAELLGMARKAGVEPEKVLEIFCSTPVASPAAKVAGSAMLAGNFTPMFPIDLVKKDFQYLLQTSLQVKSPIPLVEAVDKVLNEAVLEGLSQRNITGLASLY